MATSDRPVSASWSAGPVRCDVAIGGFAIPVERSVSSPAADRPPSPTDLLLASVASCFAMALAYTAGKRGSDLEEVRVEAAGEFEGHRCTAVRIRVAVAGSTALPPAEVERLTETAERVCYVTNTLRTPPEITVSVE